MVDVDSLWEGGRIILPIRVQTTLGATPLLNFCPPTWAVTEGMDNTVVKHQKKYKGHRGNKKEGKSVFNVFKKLLVIKRETMHF